MLKRFTTDFTVINNQKIGSEYVLLTLKHPDVLPEINAGQFVEIQIPDTAKSFLRRPISIHDVDFDNQTITLLIRIVGNGTRLLASINNGDVINMVYPLGNGFTIEKAGAKPLLVAGGVGVAPMLYLAKKLISQGAVPEFLFGARSANDLLLLETFKQHGNVNITTEDGSLGEKGFVINHSIFTDLSKFSSILVCGPTPMMKAVGKAAEAVGVRCEVSLENKMACGIGVCLCCVTDTKEGHKCVCSEGPVFEINELKW
jgi:dihydroorotate dehydrogenase electron transfer subunit